MNRQSPLHNSRGFTLVELVILLVIAAVALPGLMVYFINSMRHSAAAQVETVALGLAQELIEEVKAKRWDENSPFLQGVPPNYSAIGADGETRCNPTAVDCVAAYDDIDDYNEMNNDPPEDPHGAPLPAMFSSYQQLVTVCYVAAVQPVSDGGAGTNAGVCVDGAVTTDYKKITATVRWGANEQVQLQTIVANYQVD